MVSVRTMQGVAGAAMLAALSLGVGSARANGWMFFKNDVPDVAKGTVVFGSVKDRNGAYLPGVKIVLKHPASPASFVLRSDETGRFRSPSLGVTVPPAALSVATEKPGYRAFRQMKRLARKGSDAIEVDVVLTRS